MEHEITASELEKIASSLEANDVLIPNEVRNLAIVRDGQYIGFVNLLKGRCKVELFEGDSLEDR